MYDFINIVRAFATCLITNSHFSPIYTYDIIAKGGALGNSLFFLATGFCLANCKEDFRKWYPKRLQRLYVPLVFASFFYLYLGNNLLETIFFSFLFPQNYWFVCALVILYPIYYIVVKYPFKNRKYVYSIGLIILYAVIYGLLDKSSYMVETVEFYAIRFSYIFSFFLMLVGAYLRKHFNLIKEKVCKKRLLLFWGFWGSMVLYFGFILLMSRIKSLCQIQFLETILCITTSTFLFLFVMTFENDIANKDDNIMIRILSFLGNCTLEIYLVQFPIINAVGGLQVPSVIKFGIAVFTIVICAYILKIISGYVIRNIARAA